RRLDATVRARVRALRARSLRVSRRDLSHGRHGGRRGASGRFSTARPRVRARAGASRRADVRAGPQRRAAHLRAADELVGTVAARRDEPVRRRDAAGTLVATIPVGTSDGDRTGDLHPDRLGRRPASLHRGPRPHAHEHVDRAFHAAVARLGARRRRRRALSLVRVSAPRVQGGRQPLGTENVTQGAGGPSEERPRLHGMTTVLLLFASNIFMTAAWYGHLRFRNTPLWMVILGAWGIAFFEYCF